MTASAASLVALSVLSIAACRQLEPKGRTQVPSGVNSPHKIAFEYVTGSSSSSQMAGSHGDSWTGSYASLATVPSTVNSLATEAQTAKPSTTNPPAVNPTTKPPTTGACQCGVANPTRIVGGEEVQPAHKYPWQIGLKYKGGNGYWCGGAVINDRYILTAAHCLFDSDGNQESAEGLVVGVGDHLMSSTSDDVAATELISVEKVILHPQYNKQTFDNDIALLKLSKVLTFSTEVRPVCLPENDSKTYAGAEGIASGWGTLSSGGSQPNQLMEVTVPILDPSCWGQSVTERMLCAGYPKGGKDTCQGDSGGPLCVVEGNRYYEVGVTSHGSGCADANSPGVYSRVSKFLSWILVNTADAAYC
ncbi:trypsin-1-like [Penaeus monodon]|uniref:trypsin-1-like n=1 Tax=Penaeus monodon TaxID=6687 RepID=UPI0018A72303|nr:trypsin-1-like [Penaeus monodon]